ncbi:hypothetical protein OEZ85_008135 [Tetradesmus obliquus]|uniref:Transmembrane protein 19 n=1 Tax=Tetradesmus obliquus TaxID=3088 RepID=A0ABY8THZ7_TETOB|nr:hypothetical protein OEZ85_008135 [Tetradesmus obliquus]
MAKRGIKRKSLSPSGAVAAFIVGLLHMGCGYTFGAVLIAFFLSSSKLTHLSQERKAACDASFRLGGQRGASQVLCNSAGGALAAAAAAAAAAWSGGSSSQQGQVLQLLPWSAFLGHYACCCADTWASELGMLSSSRPRLLSSMAAVPPGTNGGVTLLGLAAGAAGGLAMGAVAWVVGWLSGELAPGLGQAASPAAAACQGAGFWLGLGIGAGCAGSLIDSLLGATLQYSGWCSRTHRVVAQAAPHVQHISGKPILSNNQVNALAALSTSAGCVAFAWWWLSAGQVLRY